MTRGYVNLLGLGYLRRYHVTLDFPNRAMYLRKGKHYSDPDRIDISPFGERQNADCEIVRPCVVNRDRPHIRIRIREPLGG